MADGKGARWNNYLGIPKHLIEINGERIIERTVRLLSCFVSESDEIIITSHDRRYEFKGAIRYEPLNNELEIDRFTRELIEDDICFLYGDTYYTLRSIKKIIDTATDDLMFFGNTKSIVAVKVKNAGIFEKHIDIVRRKYLAGEIKKCVGWQVYQSFTGQDFDVPASIKDKFVVVDEKTIDINTPEEYKVI